MQKSRSLKFINHLTFNQRLWKFKLSSFLCISVNTMQSKQIFFHVIFKKMQQKYFIFLIYDWFFMVFWVWDKVNEIDVNSFYNYLYFIWCSLQGWCRGFFVIYWSLFLFSFEGRVGFVVHLEFVNEFLLLLRIKILNSVLLDRSSENLKP